MPDWLNLDNSGGVTTGLILLVIDTILYSLIQLSKFP